MHVHVCECRCVHMPCSTHRGQRAALYVSPLVSTLLKMRSLCGSSAHARLAGPPPRGDSPAVFTLTQEHRNYRSVLSHLVLEIQTLVLMFVQQVLYPPSHYPSPIYVFYKVSITCYIFDVCSTYIKYIMNIICIKSKSGKSHVRCKETYIVVLAEIILKCHFSFTLSLHWSIK